MIHTFATAVGAVISPDGRYRYMLRRDCGPNSRTACFIMLNPSTADAERDDSTIRKCKGFARQWLCGELLVVNLFALRSRHPCLLWKNGVADPVGPDNREYIERAVNRASVTGGVICCAWGVNGRYMDQDLSVLGWIGWAKPKCLRLTRGGHPEHPLFVPYDAAFEPQPYRGRER